MGDGGYNGDDRRNPPPGRRDVDAIQTTLARIEERLKGVSESIKTLVSDMEKIEGAVQENTLRSRANEVASQRNSDTIKWVQRTITGFVIMSVLAAVWAAQVVL